MLKRVEPLRNELQKLEDDAKDNKSKAEEVEQMIRDLEASIARYKEEYAVLISEAQAIKADLAAVEAKVTHTCASTHTHAHLQIPPPHTHTHTHPCKHSHFTGTHMHTITPFSHLHPQVVKQSVHSPVQSPLRLSVDLSICGCVCESDVWLSAR